MNCIIWNQMNRQLYADEWQRLKYTISDCGLAGYEPIRAIFHQRSVRLAFNIIAGELYFQAPCFHWKINWRAKWKVEPKTWPNEMEKNRSMADKRLFNSLLPFMSKQACIAFHFLFRMTQRLDVFHGKKVLQIAITIVDHPTGLL